MPRPLIKLSFKTVSLLLLMITYTLTSQTAEGRNMKHEYLLQSKTISPTTNRLGRETDNVDDLSFIRSKIDDSEYKFMRLGNKMNIFLVSNKSFTKSVITLSMKIGSVSDPEDFPGLVSFMQETFCFFSDGKSHSSNLCGYLDSIDGTITTEVLDRSTVFTIEVDDSHVIKTLCKLSDTIRNSEFSENLFYTELERRIGSLNTLIRNEDFVFQCVKRDISLYDSIYKRQSVITSRSIKEAEMSSGSKLFNRVKQFRKESYSSNIMSMSVASGDQMAKLVRGVTVNFSTIKNLKLQNMLPQDLSKLVRHPHIGNVGNVVHLHSNVNDELIFEFPIEYQEIYWDSLPSMYLEYLLNDNSDHSLMSYLISKDLIRKMNSRVVSHSYGFSNFQISFILTKSGLDRIKTIMQATFILIEHIRNTPIAKDIVVEIQKSMANSFDYYFDVSPDHINKQIIRSFDTRGCSPEQVLIAGNLMTSTNLTETRNFIDKISVNNLVIYLRHTKEIKSVFNSKDPGIFCELDDTVELHYCKENGNDSNVSEHKASSSSSSSIEFMEQNENFRDIENTIFQSIKYYMDSIPDIVLSEVKRGIQTVSAKVLGIKIRSVNRLMKKSNLVNYRNTANYRIYSPICLRHALLDFFSREEPTLSDGVNFGIQSTLDKPIFGNIMFSSNVNFKRPTSNVFLRYMIQKQTNHVPKLSTITKSTELVLTLEVLVSCLKYVSRRVVNELNNLSGSFSINSNISSEFTGVPFGFEIMIKGGHFSSVYIAVKDFARKLRNLDKLLDLERYKVIVGELEQESRKRRNLSSKESSKLVLRSIFECQKLSKYVLETVDYSKVTLEKVLELSDYLSKYSAIEGAIIGNINPLNAYHLIKAVSHEYNDYSVDNEANESSQKSDLIDSMEVWEILDPFSTNCGTTNFYYYNPLHDSDDDSSSSVLYAPFSMLSLDVLYFKIILGIFLDLLKGRDLTEGIEFNLYPSIDNFNFVGLSVSHTSSKFNAMEISERLLSAFFKIFNLLKGIDRDEYDNFLEKNKSINNKIEPDYEQLEKRILNGIVFRKDLSYMINEIKTSQYKLSYDNFVAICHKVIDSPKFLISTQGNLHDPERLKTVENYTPVGFVRLNSIYDITDQNGIKTFKIPISYVATRA